MKSAVSARCPYCSHADRCCHAPVPVPGSEAVLGCTRGFGHCGEHVACSSEEHARARRFACAACYQDLTPEIGEREPHEDVAFRCESCGEWHCGEHRSELERGLCAPCFDRATSGREDDPRMSESVRRARFLPAGA